MCDRVFVCVRALEEKELTYQRQTLYTYTSRQDVGVH